MTAIYGLIHFDGAPASADELLGMSEAIAYWGGAGRWRIDPRGSLRVRGALMFQRNDQHQTQPR